MILVASLAFVYRSLVGSLFTTVCYKLFIYLFSRFMHCPSIAYYCATKWILRYVRGKTDYDLWLLKTMTRQEV